MIDGELDTVNTIVGYSGTGRFNQTGGSHTVGDNVVLGEDQVSGQKGEYHLSGSGSSLSANDLHVAENGTGSFFQNGGSVSVTSEFFVGRMNGSVGSYELNSGTLVTDYEHVGVESGSTGSFKQTGGSNEPNYLTLGDIAGSTGKYELSGDPSLATLLIHQDLTVGGTVGGGGNGTFTQSGGRVTVEQNLSIGTNGTYDKTGGELYVNNITNDGDFTNTGGIVNGIGGAPLTLINNGTLSGSDTITGNIENFGTVSPGESPGKLTIEGDYTQDSLATLFIELGGTTPGTYDVLDINGTATLAGLLQVILYGGFDPSPGDFFDILEANLLSGTFFDRYDLPYGRDYWDVTYGTNLVSLEFLGGGQPVPVPPSLLLFGSGLIGLMGIGLRRKRV